MPLPPASQPCHRKILAEGYTAAGKTTLAEIYSHFQLAPASGPLDRIKLDRLEANGTAALSSGRP